MGIESFFVDIIFSHYVDISTCETYLIKSLDISPNYKRTGTLIKKIRQQEHEFVYKNILIQTSSNKKLTLISCFANYDKNVIDMYSIYNAFKMKFNDITLSYGTEKLVEPINSLNAFLNLIYTWNKNRLENFHNIYGYIEIDVLPNDDFFNYINYNKKLNIASK